MEVYDHGNLRIPQDRSNIVYSFMKQERKSTVINDAVVDFNDELFNFDIEEKQKKKAAIK